MLSCLVLNVFDIQEDIENWIVVKKNCENDKEEIRHERKKWSSTKSRK